jgi:hypothetical protein
MKNVFWLEKSRIPCTPVPNFGPILKRQDISDSYDELHHPFLPELSALYEYSDSCFHLCQFGISKQWPGR